MEQTSFSPAELPETQTWQQAIAPYQKSNHRRSLGQLANSLLPYLALWVLMVLSLKVSYWLTLRGSLKSLALRLWDEQGHRLVGYPRLTSPHPS
jgi:fatty acid desaturase